MQRKLLLSALFFLFAAVGTRAQTVEQSPHEVVVEQITGDKTHYMLGKNPRITYDEGVVTLTTGDEDPALQFDASKVRRVYLSPITDGIESSKVSQNQPRVAIASDAMTVTGLEPGSEVSLYAADGRCLKATTAAADGTISLPLSQKAQGILIVKTKNQSFKIINKK